MNYMLDAWNELRYRVFCLIKEMKKFLSDKPERKTASVDCAYFSLQESCLALHIWMICDIQKGEEERMLVMDGECFLQLKKLKQQD